MTVTIQSLIDRAAMLDGNQELSASERKILVGLVAANTSEDNLVVNALQIQDDIARIKTATSTYDKNNRSPYLADQADKLSPSENSNSNPIATIRNALFKSKTSKSMPAEHIAWLLRGQTRARNRSGDNFYIALSLLGTQSSIQELRKMDSQGLATALDSVNSDLWNAWVAKQEKLGDAAGPADGKPGRRTLLALANEELSFLKSNWDEAGADIAPRAFYLNQIFNSMQPQQQKILRAELHGLPDGLLGAPQEVAAVIEARASGFVDLKPEEVEPKQDISNHDKAGIQSTDPEDANAEFLNRVGAMPAAERAAYLLELRSQQPETFAEFDSEIRKLAPKELQNLTGTDAANAVALLVALGGDSLDGALTTLDDKSWWPEFRTQFSGSLSYAENMGRSFGAIAAHVAEAADGNGNDANKLEAGRLIGALIWSLGESTPKTNEVRINKFSIEFSKTQIVKNLNYRSYGRFANYHTSLLPIDNIASWLEYFINPDRLDWDYQEKTAYERYQHDLGAREFQPKRMEELVDLVMSRTFGNMPSETVWSWY